MQTLGTLGPNSTASDPCRGHISQKFIRSLLNLGDFGWSWPDWAPCHKFARPSEHDFEQRSVQGTPRRVEEGGGSGWRARGPSGMRPGTVRARWVEPHRRPMRTTTPRVLSVGAGREARALLPVALLGDEVVHPAEPREISHSAVICTWMVRRARRWICALSASCASRPRADAQDALWPNREIAVARPIAHRSCRTRPHTTQTWT